MRFERLSRIHFVGISGIGMSGIAEVLLTMGYKVSGSDLRETEVTRRLSSLGASVVKGHDAANVGDAELVVHSSAVPPGNPEVAEARKKGIPVISRGEMLAELTRIKDSVVVSGSHGKTTVTAMVSHVASSLGQDPTVIIGGRLSTIGSSARLGRSSLMIAEADESDRSFLLLHPSAAVITNIDWEHVDTYPSLETLKDCYVEFANKVPFYGVVLACGDDRNVREVIERFRRKTLTYGMLPGSAWTASRKDPGPGGERFEVLREGRAEVMVSIPQKGSHNVLNALAAIAVCCEIGLPLEDAAESLSKFPGVDRRFDLIGAAKGVRVFDDYAHHPTEVKAMLETARLEAGSGRVVVMFQPHRYSRLRAFEEQFARVLMGADLLFITEVYAAAEAPIPGVGGESLCRRMKELGYTSCSFVQRVTEAASTVLPFLREGDVVVTTGAGTITSEGPKIVEMLGGPDEA